MSYKTQRLEMAVTSIQQRWGLRAIQKPDAAGAPFPHISTGFPVLDEVLGIGGLAKGRVSEFLGDTTSGKTTLALKFLEQAQADSAQVAYIDPEQSFDPDYAHRCGLDLSRLLIAAPCSAEEAFTITEALVGSGGFSALVFDGLDKLWSDARCGALLGASLDRLAAPLAKSASVLLFLHTPANETSAELRPLKHHATVRLWMKREEWLHSHGDIQGYSVRVEIIKNRLGAAQRAVTLTIRFDGTVHGEGL
jgi:recombination protein RecA